EPAVQELLARARERLDALDASNVQPLTFDAVLMELDSLTEGLDYAISVIRHLEAVATYPELRAAYNAAQPQVSAFYTGIPLHGGVWNTIKTYAATGEAQRLTGTRRRFLTKTMENFLRHGADLDAAGKERLAAI